MARQSKKERRRLKSRDKARQAARVERRQDVQTDAEHMMKTLLDNNVTSYMSELDGQPIEYSLEPAFLLELGKSGYFEADDAGKERIIHEVMSNPRRNMP
jgi:hypothetical protein